MTSQQGLAEVNGTRLSYEAAGEGHPLVLVHGFAADTRAWDDQLAVFARHYRVVRYDARGFGRSALPVEGTPYRHEDDLLALLAYLGVGPAHVLGHSMGGATAVKFALAHAEHTSSLALADSGLEG